MLALRVEKKKLALKDVQQFEGKGLHYFIRGMDEFRNLPMIALTACASAEDESRIRAAGYDAYLPKPIDGSELVAAVQRFTRSA